MLQMSENANEPSSGLLLLLLLLLLLKEVGNARLGGSDLHPVCRKTPAPQYKPIEKLKRNFKIWKTKWERAVNTNKKALALLLEPVSPTPSNTESVSTEILIGKIIALPNCEVL